jgi:hypothetical protein
MASDMLRYLKANMGVDGSPLTAAFVGSQCPLSAHLCRWREWRLSTESAPLRPLTEALTREPRGMNGGRSVRTARRSANGYGPLFK